MRIEPIEFEMEEIKSYKDKSTSGDSGGTSATGSDVNTMTSENE